MYKEINEERIKSLEKDLLDTVVEMKLIMKIKVEDFLKDRKSVYSIRYLLIEAVETMANICNHFLARVSGQMPKGYLTVLRNYLMLRF